MANNAYYRMKVVGKQDKVEEFIHAMNWAGEYEQQGVGRVFSCYVYEQGECEHGYYAECEGDCAWSVSSAMRAQGNPNNLEELSKRLELAIEVYCEELGCAFHERFRIVNGEIECDECIDYIEICEEDIDEYEDEFWLQPWIVDEGVTKENVMDYAIDGYIRIGGYENWDFEI